MGRRFVTGREWIFRSSVVGRLIVAVQTSGILLVQLAFVSSLLDFVWFSLYFLKSTKFICVHLFIPLLPTPIYIHIVPCPIHRLNGQTALIACTVKKRIGYPALFLSAVPQVEILYSDGVWTLVRELTPCLA